jgi:uncharacterized protein (DUF2461 family)
VRALADELYAWFREKHPELNINLHISRIYRDARRLHGAPPLNDHLWFSFQTDSWEGMVPCFYFELEPENYGCGMGFYCASAAQMVMYRREIDRDPAAMKKLDAAYRAQKTFRLEGSDYARPKGHADDNLGLWYNKKAWALCANWKYDEVSYSHALVEKLEKEYEFLLPYYQYTLKIFKQAE